VNIYIYVCVCVCECVCVSVCVSVCVCECVLPDRFGGHRPREEGATSHEHRHLLEESHLQELVSRIAVVAVVAVAMIVREGRGVLEWWRGDNTYQHVWRRALRRAHTPTTCANEMRVWQQ
jgi:hypothetical protein